MELDSIRTGRRRVALLAAPAFALALAACGGGDADVSSTDAASAPAITIEQDDSGTTESTVTESADGETPAPDETAPPATDSAEQAEPDEPAAERVVITRLSADEAIANAEVNQPNLQPAANVLDIETLAVADGSVQTLRAVVDGDRPVLLWFFSPH